MDSLKNLAINFAVSLMHRAFHGQNLILKKHLYEMRLIPMSNIQNVIFIDIVSFKEYLSLRLIRSLPMVKRFHGISVKVFMAEYRKKCGASSLLICFSD